MVGTRETRVRRRSSAACLHNATSRLQDCNTAIPKSGRLLEYGEWGTSEKVYLFITRNWVNRLSWRVYYLWLMFIHAMHARPNIINNFLKRIPAILSRQSIMGTFILISFGTVLQRRNNFIT